MNWADWYTDTVDIYRVTDVADGALTRHERQQVAEGVPCRIYRSGDNPILMSQQAASIQQTDKLACGLDVDIHAGDELIVTRGAKLGRAGPVTRAFAADPVYYYEPFGAVIPGLAHQEITLRQEERTKGGTQ